MKNIMIVGGAGFIGSHLTERLLHGPDTQSVVIFDNLTSGTVAQITHLLSDHRVKLVTKSACDLDALCATMNGTDTVFHLAANPDIAKAANSPTIDFERGTLLTNNVIEAARISGTQRLVYFSGSGVYGDHGSQAVNENSPCQPISTYGASKLASEGMISAYCHMFGLSAHSFRFANVVGPKQTHGVGYDFIRKLNSDPTKLCILGDGRQSKSYIHVEDILDAVLSLPPPEKSSHSIYNVATPDYITVLDIAKMAAQVCGLDPEKVDYQPSGGPRGWSGDVPVVRFDCAKILGTGWHSKRTSQEAMRDALVAMHQEISPGKSRSTA